MDECAGGRGSPRRCSTGVYGVVDKPDFALVIPQDLDGFWVVEQFRYPVGRRAWEFPQGSWGAGASGSTIDLARSELAEELDCVRGNCATLGICTKRTDSAARASTSISLPTCRPVPLPVGKSNRTWTIET